MLIKILTIAPPLLVAIMLHEISHGWVAGRLGDPTAKEKGRISLNPLVHIDPFMTVILPLLLIFSGSPVVFGGAKPIPVDPRYFKDPRRGMLWVALAGPATNFILAGLSYLLLLGLDWALTATVRSDLFVIVAAVVSIILFYSVIINLVLGIFNLIPVPPLDGGRILVGILPLQWARKWARLEPYGLLILVVILYFGFADKVLNPVIQIVSEHIVGGG